MTRLMLIKPLTASGLFAVIRGWRSLIYGWLSESHESSFIPLGALPVIELFHDCFINLDILSILLAGVCSQSVVISSLLCTTLVLTGSLLIGPRVALIAHDLNIGKSLVSKSVIIKVVHMEDATGATTSSALLAEHLHSIPRELFPSRGLYIALVFRRLVHGLVRRTTRISRWRAQDFAETTDSLRAVA